MKRHVHMLDLDSPSHPRLRRSVCKNCVAREEENERLRRIEAGFRAVYEPPKGEDDWYNRRLPLIRDAQAALADQPTEEEA